MNTLSVMMTGTQQGECPISSWVTQARRFIARAVMTPTRLAEYPSESKRLHSNCCPAVGAQAGVPLRRTTIASPIKWGPTRGLRTRLRAVRVGFVGLCVAFVTTTVFVGDARAQKTLDANYTVSIARVVVGDVKVQADVSDIEYTISASARISGAMQILASGDGSSIAHGEIIDGRASPMTFASKSTFAGTPPEVKMEFEDGNVVMRDTPLPGEDRVPLTEVDRRGVTDPLSALLVLTTDTDGLSKEVCQRTVPIFDGGQRCNIHLYLQTK
jgi:hypothetical protein